MTCFLKGTLDKIGASADFEKIGDYKTAPNQLTQTTHTPAHREMSEWLTRDMFEQLVRGVAEGRKKKVEEVRALIDEGPFLAGQAVSAGLVDTLAYEDQLDDHGAVSKSGTVEGDVYGRSRRGFAARNAPRIAVLYISGIINSGESGFDPLNGDVAGSMRLVKAIRAARADASVRAIVVRIDSPGGSSIASDVIWRELVVTRDEKPARPLVASMSDLAASGGYYVAVAAPTIVAQPATLTGSIGIYGGKFILGGTYAKLGANIESVIIGRNAGMESPDRPFTESERAELQEQMRSFYQGFVGKVAAARKMPAERVEQLAQGRVWTGAQARQHGLVDALGGLDRAIALAKERAGIAADTEVEVVNYPPRRTLAEMLLEELSGSGNNDSQMEALLSVVGGPSHGRAPRAGRADGARAAVHSRRAAGADADEFSPLIILSRHSNHRDHRDAEKSLSRFLCVLRVLCASRHRYDSYPIARLSASGSISIFILSRAFSMYAW